MFNILDYGAVSGGKILCSEAFQKAIDACNEAGGGTVYVPGGTYLMGTVFLKDNVHIFLDAGALILGSTDLKNDFAPDEEIPYPVFQDASHTFFHHSLFVGENLKNISITGSGKVDMQSKYESDDFTPVRGIGVCTKGSFRGAKIVAFKECSNIILKDFSLYNATDLAIYLAGCEDIRVSGLLIDTHIDGINVDCCKNTVISDCIIRSGDDGIVPKSSYVLGRKQLTENLVVTNCIVSSECNAIKLGTESNGGFKNVTVSNCVITDTRSVGLSVEAVDGGDIDGVTFTNITMNNVGCPFFVIIGDRARGPEGTGIGTIKNLSISHVIYTGPFNELPRKRSPYYRHLDYLPFNKQGGMIVGLPGHYVENVRLEDIYLQVDGGVDTPVESVPERPKGYPDADIFGTLNSYGFFIRHAKNVKAVDIRAEVINPDARPEITIDDVENFVRV